MYIITNRELPYILINMEEPKCRKKGHIICIIYLIGSIHCNLIKYYTGHSSGGGGGCGGGRLSWT